MSALRSLARVSFLAAAVLPWAGWVEAANAPQPSASGDRRLNPFDQGVIDRVRTRAAAKLNEPECGKLLTDFTDRHGRTLRENLEPLGLSAAQYLQRIAFVDGTSQPRCRKLDVMMATTPGVPRVFVCPLPGQINSRLSRLEFQRGSLAEAMVIHEMLHTLGLGENPPSSLEITERVRDRCR